MELPFSERPGCQERHLRRRLDNPLFAPADRAVELGDVIAARAADEKEAEAFREHLRALFDEAAKLAANVQSDVVLGLKERADQLYETACGLGGGDHDAEKTALKRLIDAIMKSVWRGAAGDQQALGKLEQEEIARAQHFELLFNPLVADILRPDSPIEPEQLAATLLSEPDESLRKLLVIFDPDQRDSLAASARALLESRRDGGWEAHETWMRLGLIEAFTDGPGT